MKSLLVITVLAAMAIAVCHADPGNSYWLANLVSHKQTKLTLFPFAVIKTINIRPGVDEEHFVENVSICHNF